MLDDSVYFCVVYSQIASEHNIRFFETSAKANINIEKAFLKLAEDILRKVSHPYDNCDSSNVYKTCYCYLWWYQFT